MKSNCLRLTHRTYTLRNYFFYVTLIATTFFVGWHSHRVSNERAESLRQQKQHANFQDRIVSANLHEFCRNAMTLPGVKKVDVLKGQLDRYNPTNSELIFAVTPETVLDESLANSIRMLCSNRFAGVQLGKISVVDASSNIVHQ